MKTCNRCDETKPYDEFSRMTKAKDGYQYTCKTCNKIAEKGRREYHKKKMKKARANPEFKINEAANKRDYRLQYFYGITEETYQQILKSQDYKCLICERKDSELSKKLAVDHNHITGEIRGLLCDRCNRGLGLFKDDVETLSKAIRYLNKKGSYSFAKQS